MTEFEMAYLLNEFNVSASIYASTAFTTVSGFLVASYLAAHRLSWPMLSVFITVYALWYWGAVARLMWTLSNISGLASKMRLFAEQAKGLEWHNASLSSVDSLWIAQIATAVLMALVFTATIVFFFHCRRVNRKAEAGAWKPKA